MDTIDKIMYICGCDFNPSVKLTLIALINEGEPMTTADINYTLNLHKTRQNYEELLADLIDAGYIRKVSLKTKNSITRIHFELDDSIFEDSLD